MRQVLPIVGAVIGAYFGGPQGAQIGYAIGSLVGNAVDPLEVAGNRVGDSPVQTASEGGARAILFGTACIRATCVLERGNRRVIKQKITQGKGAGPVTINERALWTFAIGIGEAIPGGTILRAWENEKLVYDVTPSSSIVEETRNFARKFRFYDGSESQLPDPALESIHGLGNAPYYRGTTYAVFPDYDLTDFGESIPTYRWEIAAVSAVIEPTAALITGTGLGSSFSWLESPNGTDWSGSVNTGPGTIGYGQLITTRDTYISFETGESAIGYLESGSSSWTISGGDGVGGTGGKRLGYYDGSTVAIATPDGIAISEDNGRSFQRNPSGVQAHAIFKCGFRWIALSQVGIEYIIYDGTSPDELALFGPSNIELASIFDADSNGEIGRVVGSPFVPGDPSIFVAGGFDFEPEIAPIVSGDYATCVGFGIVDDTEAWVVGTKDGDIFAKYGGGDWQYTSSFGAYVTSVSFNGSHFIMVGGQYVSGDTQAFIKTSTDLQNWTTARTFDISAGGSLRAVKAIPYILHVAQGQPVPLNQIIARFHERAKHTPTEFDVSELNDMVDGLLIEQSVSAAEAIKGTVANYFADPVDYDGKIHYIKRGKPVVRTLIGDIVDGCDVVDEPESSRRENAIEYPRKLHLFFQSSDTDYSSSNEATSSRYSQDLAVVGEVSINTPVAFATAHEPYEIAIKLHKVSWSEAEGEVDWTVSDSHIDLVPTDCVGLSYRGQIRRARIVSLEINPGSIDLKMKIDRQSAYTANLTEIPQAPPVTPPQSSIVAPTALAVMDIPALTDNSDMLTLYAAMSGEGDNWIGSTLQRSLDDGAIYSSLASSAINSTMGVLVSPVSEASPYYTDTTNSVVINVYTDDPLEAITEQAFLSEGGAFALSYETSNGRQWELMQYRDVVQDSSGNYVLSRLHRGQLETEAVHHAAGSIFVLIDETVLRTGTQSAWIGEELTHRAVSHGLSPETAEPQNLTYQANSQREWPVASVAASSAAGVITITIVPRHRFGTDLHPVRSVNWVGYRVVFEDAAAQVATIETSDSVVSYDASLMTFPVTVTVHQLNRYTGAGPGVSEIVNE